MLKKSLLPGLVASICLLTLNALHASENIEIATSKSRVVGKKDSPKNQPVTTGFLQELTEKRIHLGKNRTGAEVYEYRCKGCHGKNTQGAPMPDDLFEWSMRLKEKSLTVLLTHSMDGFNNYLMPPKGGCRDCNQQEVYAAVFYMLERSGVQLTKADEVVRTKNQDETQSKIGSSE